MASFSSERTVVQSPPPDETQAGGPLNQGPPWVGVEAAIDASEKAAGQTQKVAE